jgi:hypothetical protein
MIDDLLLEKKLLELKILDALKNQSYDNLPFLFKEYTLNNRYLRICEAYIRCDEKQGVK